MTPRVAVGHRRLPKSDRPKSGATAEKKRKWSPSSKWKKRTATDKETAAEKRKIAAKRKKMHKTISCAVARFAIHPNSKLSRRVDAIADGTFNHAADCVSQSLKYVVAISASEREGFKKDLDWEDGLGKDMTAYVRSYVAAAFEGTGRGAFVHRRVSFPKYVPKAFLPFLSIQKVPPSAVVSRTHRKADKIPTNFASAFLRCSRGVAPPRRLARSPIKMIDLT